jgi:hypothetical protein
VAKKLCKPQGRRKVDRPKLRSLEMERLVYGTCLRQKRVKGKGKVHTRRDHEDPEVE